jgi:CO/xanthine dehydrogenase Mo-binding subunit
MALNTVSVSALVRDYTDAPPFQLLEVLRDALAGIAGIASCKIGLEDSICPDDYPMIRIVPSRMGGGVAYNRRKMELLIYFGLPISPFDDVPDNYGRTRLEKLYAELFGLEADIRLVIHQNGGIYRDTITDEDRLDTYKLMAIRCDLEG